MGGEVFEGLSGGQRKMFLFELICQRTEGAKDLLLILDEPFAGITEDFMPYIEERLTRLRQKHNVLVSSGMSVRACIPTTLPRNT